MAAPLRTTLTRLAGRQVELESRHWLGETPLVGEAELRGILTWGGPSRSSSSPIFLNVRALCRRQPLEVALGNWTG